MAQFYGKRNDAKPMNRNEEQMYTIHRIASQIEWKQILINFSLFFCSFCNAFSACIDVNVKQQEQHWENSKVVHEKWLNAIWPLFSSWKWFFFFSLFSVGSLLLLFHYCVNVRGNSLFIMFVSSKWELCVCVVLFILSKLRNAQTHVIPTTYFTFCSRIKEVYVSWSAITIKWNWLKAFVSFKFKRTEEKKNPREKWCKTIAEGMKEIKKNPTARTNTRQFSRGLLKNDRKWMAKLLIYKMWFFTSSLRAFGIQPRKMFYSWAEFFAV